MAQARLGEAEVQLRALRAALDDTVGGIDALVRAGDAVPLVARARARMTAAHIVHQSRAVIGMLAEASGASAHFVSNPLQRIKRDVDVVAGPVIFDYDTSRKRAGAPAIGAKIPPFAMM
jgi:alkylation response protein AidB-like acyl-CoA dehydrogenase